MAASQDWFDDNNPEGPQRGPGPSTTPPPSTGGTDFSGDWQNLYHFAPSANPTSTDVNKAFSQFLGHNATDVSPWANDPNYAQHIYDSQEAQNYRKTHRPDGTGATPPAAASTGSGDPARDAVMAAFAKKGVTPNAGEVDYWVGKINDTGGWDKPDNQSYWASRMAQDQGGVGDRQGRPESGSDPLGSDLLKPYTKTFDYAPFQAPDNITEQNDPGFQSRLQLGQQALERSAAAKGTLLTGGTAKDLQSFGQNFASNEYGNVYGRAANDYNTNRNNAYQQYLGDESTFYANQNNPFAKLLSMSQLDQQGQIANGQLGLGYAGLNSNNLNANNNLNYNYAALGVNNLNNGANQYGNYTTQAGNAGAAGTVAGANAWQNAFGGVGNSGLAAYYRQHPPTNPYGFSGWPGSQAGG